MTKKIHGDGEYQYEFVSDWAQLPENMSITEASSVGVDSKDNVYVFDRSPPYVKVFTREGKFLRAWGEGIFHRPHGLHIGPDDTLWLTDDGDHSVRQCTPDGKILLEIGIPNRPSPFMSGKPFNRCTHTALSPGGDVYVADGYGNAKVHKYDPSGRPLLSWGSSGSDAGQFNIVHNICCDDDGWVYVADRENHRVQVFDGNGRYETQWNNLHRPSAMFMPRGKCPHCYIGEFGPVMGVNREAPNLGPRVTIVSNDGLKLSRIGGEGPGMEDGKFLAPHGVAVDSHGDMYVAEVGVTSWPVLFPGTPKPAMVPTLKKLRRVAVSTAE